MKTLNFEGPNGLERYEVLYDGLCHTNRSLNTAEARVHSRLLDKMEVIGKPAERGGLATFTLAEITPLEVQIEDVEFRLLSECLADVAWSSKASRLIARVFDWFEESTK